MNCLCATCWGAVDFAAVDDCMKFVLHTNVLLDVFLDEVSSFLFEEAQRAVVVFTGVCFVDLSVVILVAYLD